MPPLRSVRHGPTGVTFRDNIFVGASGGSPIDDTRSVYENNLYWRTAQPRDTSAVTADPLLVSASPTAPRDVRLRAGSPALGTGIPVADGITRDYFGNRIPTPPNLSADQHREPLSRTRITPATRPPVSIPTRRPGLTSPEARRVLPVRVSGGRARRHVGAPVVRASSVAVRENFAHHAKLHSMHLRECRRHATRAART